MLPGSRPVGVRLVAAVVAAERAGRLGQQPDAVAGCGSPAPSTWTGPVQTFQGSRVSASTCSGEPAASLLVIACARDGYALLVADYDSW